MPQASAKAVASATVSSDAVSGAMISTSDITGAGLKKWTPSTWSGRWVATAISMTGRVEVLVARMASCLTMLSSSANSARLMPRSSTTDSITRSQSTRSPEVVGGADAAEGSVRVVLLELAPLDLLGQGLVSSVATMASALSCLRDRSTTSKPAFAATSAMPDPMMPDPRIPTRSIMERP